MDDMNMILPDNLLQMSTFKKNQECQCDFPTESKLNRTTSLGDLPSHHQCNSDTNCYTFNTMHIDKPTGAKPTLGLTFDRDDYRPPILKSIDPLGCFADNKDLAPGDRLLLLDNCLYGVKTLADIKQHFLNVKEGTPMRMCWLRRTDNMPSYNCCSERCFELRKEVQDLTKKLEKVQIDSKLEESHEKLELIRIQNVLAQAVKTAHSSNLALGAEVESLKEASQFLQTECEQQVKELRSQISDQQSQIEALTVNLRDVNRLIPAGMPLDTIPVNAQHFRPFFQQHREMYRRYLLEAIQENSKLQSQCATHDGEVVKLTRLHNEQLDMKDLEIAKLKASLKQEEDRGKERIQQLDELFVRNLTLEDELREKKSEISSLSQTREELAKIGNHQDLVNHMERQCQDYLQQLLQANEKIDTLRLQNASLKTQLQSNEQSLQELQRSLTGSTN